MQNTIYSAEDEQELMARLWSPAIKDNPLAFVMFAFPWQVKGTPLENFAGPRKWQREVLLDIAEHIRLNQGKLDFDVLQEAISSGRGIGKSALVSWLVIWMISTRIGSTTIVSANSESQLRSITWAEITKWLAMAINSHWFEVSRHQSDARQVADRVGGAGFEEGHQILGRGRALVVSGKPRRVRWCAQFRRCFGDF
jgi:hypothetical protein